jgi:hypothetical protein
MNILNILLNKPLNNNPKEQSSFKSNKMDQQRTFKQTNCKIKRYKEINIHLWKSSKQLDYICNYLYQ